MTQIIQPHKKEKVLQIMLDNGLTTSILCAYDQSTVQAIVKKALLGDGWAAIVDKDGEEIFINMNKVVTWFIREAPQQRKVQGVQIKPQIDPRNLRKS